MVAAIQRLLEECEQKLALIDEAREAEMRKPVNKRSPRFIEFLHKEQAVYSFGVYLLTELLKASRQA